MKMFWRASLLACCAVTLAGCHPTEPNTQAVSQIAEATIVESRKQEVPLALRSIGTVHARETALISPQIVGCIQQVLVREGDRVRAGQALVLLEDAATRSSADQAHAAVMAAQNQLAAAEVDARLAASTLDRYKRLELQKSVSPQEMDEVARRSEAAAARVEAVRYQADAARAQESGVHAILGYSRLTAPFAGVVTSRMADPGTMASPGVPLLQIDQSGPLQLHATIDESTMSSIQAGMKVQTRIDNGSASVLTGTVAEILPTADAASHSFVVKIDLPSSPGLRAGMYGTAEFVRGARLAIMIPHSAVVMRGSLPVVYVLDAQGIAQLRSLTLGPMEGDSVEVLSGVSAGEKLIDQPGDRELAGKRISSSHAEVQR